MKLVVDTNRIIAALIKNGISRRIIFEDSLKFITPDHSLAEIAKYKDEILAKAYISDAELEVLLFLIFEQIEIIPKEEYENFLEEAKQLIKDIGDVPFIALCLASKADGIWTDDAHFLDQNKTKIFRTIHMLEFMKNPKV